MRFVAMVVLMALTVLHLSADPIAALTPDKESLRGLPGVKLVIGQLSPEAQADGLSEDSIRNAVELILRSSGIRILDGPRLPHLYVHVIIVKSTSGSYTYIIPVEVNQWVSLVDRPEWSAFAATWKRFRFGHIGARNIRDVISDIEESVKAFANDFLAANPK